MSEDVRGAGRGLAVLMGLTGTHCTGAGRINKADRRCGPPPDAAELHLLVMVSTERELGLERVFDDGNAAFTELETGLHEERGASTIRSSCLRRAGRFVVSCSHCSIGRDHTPSSPRAARRRVRRGAASRSQSPLAEALSV